MGSNHTETDMMERLLQLTEHRESITRQQAQEWFADEDFMSLLEQHLDTQRALVTAPDSREAFRHFLARHDEEAPSPKRTWLIRLVIAAAACAALVFGLSYYKNIRTEHFETRMLQAKAINDDLTCYVGSQPVTQQSSPQKSPLIIHGNEITVSPSVLSEAEVYEKTTLVVPDGKVARLSLPDGTIIHLNAGSSIIFPPKFAEGEPRRVRLKGEAYFSVHHEEDCPFIVECGDMQTTVLGTEFNVCGYEHQPVHVTLIKGAVRVSAGKDQQTLRPGEDACIENGNDISIEKVYTNPITAWKDGILYFNEVPLREILVRLSRTFNMRIVINDNTRLDDKLHLVVDKEAGIHEIVDRLNLISGKHIAVNPHQLVIN